MRTVKICAGLVVLFIACSCTTIGPRGASQRPSLSERIERASRFVTRTVLDVSNDVLPLVKAATEEISRDVKDDVPKLVEEVRNQATHITSIRSSREPKP
jgi:hypothetical protein